MITITSNKMHAKMASIKI